MIACGATADSALLHARAATIIAMSLFTPFRILFFDMLYVYDLIYGSDNSKCRKRPPAWCHHQTEVSSFRTLRPF